MGRNRDSRQARFYSLTAARLQQLGKEAANWDRLSSAINLVVQASLGAMPWRGFEDYGFGCKACTAVSDSPKN
jgi:hypothetical protein